MKLFCLTTTRELTEKIAAEGGWQIAAHEERDFEDTEFKVRPLERVRGEQVFVCQSLAGDDTQSSSDKLCRLLFFIGALKDAGAVEVTALVPYLAYSRKDRRTKPRDPVTTRYVAALLESVGVDVVVTLDVHNLAAFENSFRRRTLHLESASLFVQHFRQSLPAGRRIVVMSPDAGGVKRARRFAAELAEASGQPVDLAFMEKERSEGRVSGQAFAGDVDGATVIVFDDLISGGTTIARAAQAAAARGARTVHAAATHAVFGRGAAEKLAAPELASVVVSDTVGDPWARCPSLGDGLVVLDSAPLLAEGIRRLR